MIIRYLVITSFLANFFFVLSPVKAAPLDDPLSGKSPAASQATIYYVDAVNGSNDTGDGGPTAPWKTITFALSQISGPDVELHVASGLYDTTLGENFPLTMEPGVSLIGTSFSSTVISGTTTTSVVVFSNATIYTETTRLEGFKITNGSEGIHLEGNYGNGTSPIIEANWLTGNVHGLTGYAAGGRQLYAHIRHNLISENAQYGIYSESRRPSSYINLDIAGNQIVRNGNAGIFCWTESYFDSTSTCSPVLTGNRIADNGASGIICSTYYDGQCNMQVIGNVIAGNQGWGYTHYHDGSWQYSYPKFINNIVYENTDGGVGFSVDYPTDLPPWNYSKK